MTDDKPEEKFIVPKDGLTCPYCGKHVAMIHVVNGPDGKPNNLVTHEWPACEVFMSQDGNEFLANAILLEVRAHTGNKPQA